MCRTKIFASLQDQEYSTIAKTRTLPETNRKTLGAPPFAEEGARILVGPQGV